MSNDVISVGVVIHVDCDSLKKVREILNNLPDSRLIYFKASTSSLWIKEGKEEP